MKNAISTLKVKQVGGCFFFFSITQVLCVDKSARSEMNPRRTDLNVAPVHVCPRQTCTYIQYDSNQW